MLGAPQTGPIGAVREGMHVVDVDGEEIGTVTEIRMSDAGALSGGAGPEAGGIVGTLDDVLGGGESLPEQEQRRLARLGYVRIDARGLLARDTYAAADEIADVTGDQVHLTVPKDRLVG